MTFLAALLRLARRLRIRRRRRGDDGEQLIPFELFGLLLCLLAGIPILAGRTPVPGTVNAALDPDAAIVWCAALVTGAATTLAGIFWHFLWHKRQLLGITIEQCGLLITGTATIIYAYCAKQEATPQANVFIAFVLAFGLACVWRWWQLVRRIRKHVQQHDDREA